MFEILQLVPAAAVLLSELMRIKLYESLRNFGSSCSTSRAIEIHIWDCRQPRDTPDKISSKDDWKRLFKSSPTADALSGPLHSSFVWNLATSSLCGRITLWAYANKALRVIKNTQGAMKHVQGPSGSSLHVSWNVHIFSSFCHPNLRLWTQPGEPWKSSSHKTVEIGRSAMFKSVSFS